jgi:hypothetical protein
MSALPDAGPDDARPAGASDAPTAGASRWLPSGRALSAGAACLSVGPVVLIAG